ASTAGGDAAAHRRRHARRGAVPALPEVQSLRHLRRPRLTPAPPVRLQRLAGQVDDQVDVTRFYPPPIGISCPAHRAVVVQPVDQLPGQAKLDPLISVEVEELSAVNPERGLAVELRRPLFDVR